MEGICSGGQPADRHSHAASYGSDAVPYDRLTLLQFKYSACKDLLALFIYAVFDNIEFYRLIGYHYAVPGLIQGCMILSCQNIDLTLRIDLKFHIRCQSISLGSCCFLQHIGLSGCKSFKGVRAVIIIRKSCYLLFAVLFRDCKLRTVLSKNIAVLINLCDDHRTDIVIYDHKVRDLSVRSLHDLIIACNLNTVILPEPYGCCSGNGIACRCRCFGKSIIPGRQSVYDLVRSIGGPGHSLCKAAAAESHYRA